MFFIVLFVEQNPAVTITIIKGNIFVIEDQNIFSSQRRRESFKLAASVAMNPHYHRYAELSSPHPPSPDNNNYPQMGGGGHHHNGHGPTMNPIEGHQQGFHHINNNNLPIKQCAGCAGNLIFGIYFPMMCVMLTRRFSFRLFRKNYREIFSASAGSLLA